MTGLLQTGGPMDRRILRTKKALKDTLMELLKKQNFESITVSQICDSAMVSRNTFYNYYTDKYALLEDCFKDYESRFEQHFEALQNTDNPDGKNIEKGFMNLIDTFLDTDFIYQSIPLLSSFDLMSLYYQSSMNILKKYEKQYAAFINPDYDLGQLNSFLVLGFCGFIHGSKKIDRDTVRRNTRKLVLDLLDSPIFRIESQQK